MLCSPVKKKRKEIGVIQKDIAVSKFQSIKTHIWESNREENVSSCHRQCIRQMAVRCSMSTVASAVAVVSPSLPRGLFLFRGRKTKLGRLLGSWWLFFFFSRETGTSPLIGTCRGNVAMATTPSFSSFCFAYLLFSRLPASVGVCVLFSLLMSVGYRRSAGRLCAELGNDIWVKALPRLWLAEGETRELMPLMGAIAYLWVHL